VRKNGTLNYLISDHLGSTSIVTNASGNVVNQTQYKAWGEERYSSGTKQTNYGYAGQYSYAADFGLQFYNARRYDISLGRFAQADSIITGAGNSAAWDRCAYTLNIPLQIISHIFGGVFIRTIILCYTF
jgi:RHS repeat-associated protein